MLSEACTPFVNAIRQARLLSDAQLTEILRSHDSCREPRALALELVRRDWLTPFQVERLARGKGGELVLGKYILLERLGEGGMGQVFKARHRVMDRLVALKIIRPDLLHHASVIRRFHQEIRAVAQLSHPNIVTAHDADQDGDTHFLVMEYVQGIDLKQLVQRAGRLGVGQACDYIRQAALGLQHAHERGMVHRDLKPGNLLLAASRLSPVAPNEREGASGGVVKILDLGLALLQSVDAAKNGASVSTHKGALMGTPDYMAPEQAIDPRGVDIRADLYSLGCTLFYLLTARAPFEDSSLLEKLYKHKFEPPLPLESLRTDVPPAVATIVHKLIAKEPEDRYQTPAEVVKALQPLCHANDAVALPSSAMNAALESPRSTSTLGSRSDRPDTMCAPDILEADAGRAPTGGVSVSLERALEALDGVKGGMSDTPRMPGMSSISDFMPLDSRLDQSLTPVLPPVRKRRRGVVAVVMGGVAIAVLAGIAVRLGMSKPENTEQPPALAAGNSQTMEPKNANAGALEEQEQRVAAAREGEATPAKLGEPGQAKPLLTAAGAELVRVKPEANADAAEARAMAKPAAGVEPITWKIPQEKPLESASFTPDAQWFQILSEDSVTVYDLRDTQAGPKVACFFAYDFQTFQGAKAPLRIALSPQGDRVLIATKDSVQRRGQLPPPGPMLGSYKPNSPRPWHKHAAGSAAIICICSCPSDALLALTGDQFGTVSLWQFGEELRQRHAWSGQHKMLVECLAVSGAGNRALSGDRGGKLWVWNLNKGEPQCELIGHDKPINAVALSADGSLAASADENTLRLWDVVNGRELRQLPQPLARSVHCLAFSRDGMRLASGGDSGKVLLWNVETGMLHRERPGHTAPVLAVAFTSDGDAVSSVAKDNTIRRWDLVPPAGVFRPSQVANGSQASPAAVKD
jgi:serine/threonine protein kinase